ncbi:MAG: hypothetical protein E6R04_09335 [Spirochaetes bacterium]|nr:MAG: hypothetical protein E6R04_09335 [Spirochaetota bacterium]
MVIELTAKNVESIMVYCLYKEDELKEAKTRPPEGCIMVEAVIHKFGFHPDRVQEKAKDIEVLLRQLPEEFYATKGGGMSFLRACLRFDGEQWGEHAEMEMLMALGMATKKVTCLMPKELWGALPGGMPYYRVEV